MVAPYMNLSAVNRISVFLFSVEHTLEPSHFLHAPPKDKDRMGFDEVGLHFCSTLLHHPGFVYEGVLH